MTEVSTKARPSTIRTQLREYLLTGLSPEDAAQRLLEPYGGDSDPLCAFVWPIVLKAARDEEGRIDRTSRSDVFYGGEGSTPGSRAQLLHQRLALPRMVYRMPDGSRVLWDDLTADKINIKLAYLRTQVGGLIDHIMILEAARLVLARHGASRLGEVSSWVEEVRDLVPENSWQIIQTITAATTMPESRGTSKPAPRGNGS